MSQLKKITSYILPDVYPENYIDESLFNEDINVREQISDLEQEVKTEWGGETDIRVQSIRWDRYTLNIVSQTPLMKGLSLLKGAKAVNLEYEDGLIHSAEILEVTESSRLTSSWLYGVILTYKDLNSKVIINYHDYDNFPSLLNQENTLTLESSKAIDAEWTSLIGDEGLLTFKTNLDLILAIPEQEEKADVKTTLKKVRQNITGRNIQMRFFMTRTNKNIFEKYAPLCDQVIAYDGIGQYNALEPLEPEIEEVSENMYKIDINYKYENTIFYRY